MALAALLAKCSGMTMVFVYHRLPSAFLVLPSSMPLGEVNGKAF